MLVRQALASVRIGEHDGFRAVFRKHHESLARAAVGLGVDVDLQIPQHPQGGWMEPLPGQSTGPLRIGFKQGDPGALAGMGECADAAHRASADHGNVVARQRCAAQLKALARERRR